MKVTAKLIDSEGNEIIPPKRVGDEYYIYVSGPEFQGWVAQDPVEGSSFSYDPKFEGYTEEEMNRIYSDLWTPHIRYRPARKRYIIKRSTRTRRVRK